MAVCYELFLIWSCVYTSVLFPSCLAMTVLEAGLMALPALGTSMARKGSHVIVPHFANFTICQVEACTYVLLLVQMYHWGLHM